MRQYTCIKYIDFYQPYLDPLLKALRDELFLNMFFKNIIHNFRVSIFHLANSHENLNILRYLCSNYSLLTMFIIVYNSLYPSSLYDQMSRTVEYVVLLH